MNEIILIRSNTVEVLGYTNHDAGHYIEWINDDGGLIRVRRKPSSQFWPEPCQCPVCLGTRVRRGLMR